MELRSCIHLHFVDALKGGLVTKALNVSRGKPFLKFKTLNDIYKTEDEKNQSPDDEFEGFLFDRVKVERPTISDSDVSEFSCNEDDGGSNGNLDDLGTGNMTLKQIQEKCKAKKRKRSKFADSRTDKLRFQVKEEADEDECDLMEPLITWKAKISKKVKGKTRCSKNQVSMPLQSPMLMVKSEQLPSDQDFTGSTESLLVNVKVEAPETDYSDNRVIIGDSSLLYDDQVDSVRDSQSSRDPVEMATGCVLETQVPCSERGDIICFVDDSSLIHDDKVDSRRVVLNEVSKTDAETETSNSLTEEPQTSVLSQEHNGCVEDGISEPFEVLNIQVDSCGTVPSEVTEIAHECFLGSEKLTSEIEEPHLCAVSEVCCDSVEHDSSEHVHNVTSSCADMKKVGIAEAENGLDLDFPVLESEGEGYVDKPLCANISQELMLPNCDHRYDVTDALFCPANNVIPCDINSSPKVQSPDEATYGCFQDIESNVGSDACTLDDGAKVDLPSILETGALYSSDGEFSLAHNSFIISSEDSPTTEQKQSQRSSTCDVVETNCFPQTLSCDAQKELTTSDGDGNYYSNLDPPPQRLLSTRKAISPDSQEKLCKAMESIEIHEEEHYRPQKKLCFEQQNGKETKVNKAERSGRITKIRFSVNQKQNIPKPKQEKRNSQTNVVLNGSHPSHSAPRFTTGCNSIESCSKSAIAFSQRQMQDIECLTTKLTNELKTMKEIAEDRLYSETFPATSLKYKANEVRMAIKSATKVEQLANKWLSMMARDCNRFCKIMGLAEKDSDVAETESIANKERRKITFADEAGAQLCHVKFFENLTESTLEPDTRPEVLS